MTKLPSNWLATVGSLTRNSLDNRSVIDEIAPKYHNMAPPRDPLLDELPKEVQKLFIDDSRIPDNMVIILRGPPGCGKTSMAQVIQMLHARKRRSCVAVSADEWFYVNGEYCYEERDLHKAHDFCMGQFLLAINRGVKCVIVDNTNLKLSDFEWYEAEARKTLYYKVVHLDWEIPHSDKFPDDKTAEICAARSLHFRYWPRSYYEERYEIFPDHGTHPDAFIKLQVDTENRSHLRHTPDGVRLGLSSSDAFCGQKRRISEVRGYDDDYQQRGKQSGY